MIGWIRVIFARFLMRRTPKQINETIAIKWNHLQAVCIMKGRIKFDWYKVLGKPRFRCKRCLKTIKEVGHCTPCKEWIDEQDKKQPKRSRRKNSRRRQQKTS
jgi:hypothetical protein